MKIKQEMLQCGKRIKYLDLLRKNIKPFDFLRLLNLNNKNSNESRSPSGNVMGMLIYCGADGVRIKYLPKVLINIKCVTIVRGYKNESKRINR